MAAFDLLETLNANTHATDDQTRGWLATVQATWRTFRAWTAERREIVKLSRLDPRLVRDMGFDPEAIRTAVEDSWDEVDPGRYHGLSD